MGRRKGATEVSKLFLTLSVINVFMVWFMITLAVCRTRRAVCAYYATTGNSVSLTHAKPHSIISQFNGFLLVVTIWYSNWEVSKLEINIHTFSMNCLWAKKSITHYSLLNMYKFCAQMFGYSFTKLQHNKKYKWLPQHPHIRACNSLWVICPHSKHRALCLSTLRVFAKCLRFNYAVSIQLNDKYGEILYFS